MDLGLERIKPMSAITILGIVGGSIIPGFLFLFIFERELFLTLDKFLLCLIAPSVTLPILIINSVLVIISVPQKDRTDDELHRRFAAAAYLGSIITSMVLYLAIIIGYFFYLSTKIGVLIVIGAELVSAILLLSQFKKPNK